MFLRRLLALFGTISGALFGWLFPVLIVLMKQCFDCYSGMAGIVQILPAFAMWLMILIGVIGFFIAFLNVNIGRKIQSNAGFLSMFCGVVIVFFTKSMPFDAVSLLSLFLAIVPAMLFILSSRLIQQVR